MGSASVRAVDHLDARVGERAAHVGQERGWHPSAPREHRAQRQGLSPLQQVVDQRTEEGGRARGGRDPVLEHLGDDARRIERADVPQVAVGQDAGRARSQAVEQEDRQRRQIDVGRTQAHVTGEHAVLSEQEAVRAPHGLGQAGRSGREGEQGGLGLGRSAPFEGWRVHGVEGGGEREPAVGGVQDTATQLGCQQTQPLRPGRADQPVHAHSPERLAHAAGAGARIDQHGRVPAPEQGQQRLVEADAHREQEHDAVTGLQPARSERAGKPARAVRQLGEGAASPGRLDQGRAIGGFGRPAREQLADVVHGCLERLLEQRVAAEHLATVPADVVAVALGPHQTVHSGLVAGLAGGAVSRGHEPRAHAEAPGTPGLPPASSPGTSPARALRSRAPRTGSRPRAPWRCERRA